jgi:MoaA/NifB/PqqE/SkfB family radical SAM enzyme
MTATVPLLKLLQIDLTDECPLFCGHCSNSSGPGRNTHFPVAKLREIINEGRDLGLETVVYSGGEPLRYPDLHEALSAAKIGGTPATIFTTGITEKKTRLPVSVERWRQLRDFGLVGARFSVYSGPTHREFHNNVVQTRPINGDAFGVNEQAIKDARSAGIFVEAHFVPSGCSIVDLPEIYSWAERIGCSTLHLQIPTYQGRNKDSPLLELSYADEACLKQTALALRSIPGQMEFYISRFWMSRWENADHPNSAANLEQLVIRTDGTISPSNACKYGSVMLEPENVLTDGATLADIWRHSRTLGELREAHGRMHLSHPGDRELVAISGAKVLYRSAY